MALLEAEVGVNAHAICTVHNSLVGTQLCDCNDFSRRDRTFGLVASLGVQTYRPCRQQAEAEREEADWHLQKLKDLCFGRRPKRQSSLKHQLSKEEQQSRILEEERPCCLALRASEEGFCCCTVNDPQRLEIDCKTPPEPVVHHLSIRPHRMIPVCLLRYDCDFCWLPCDLSPNLVGQKNSTIVARCPSDPRHVELVVCDLPLNGSDICAFLSILIVSWGSACLSPACFFDFFCFHRNLLLVLSSGCT